ncbi:MAG: hypothetical protein CMI53_01875 [Parcubacteria group bacterium]|jgi:hypothetical protein|nr:hypothetical protein [Parcubacteria group bacterium]|tara:strand:- start:3260 stop:3556 length:297 start_codon:yes stop_codon:yes gene_type:complete
MPTEFTCSDCGNKVSTEVIDGDRVACVHPNPDNTDEDCPGSGISPEESAVSAIDSEDDVIKHTGPQNDFRSAPTTEELPTSELPQVDRNPHPASVPSL